jgi:hypothetical protein
MSIRRGKMNPLLGFSFPAYKMTKKMKECSLMHTKVF